MLFRSVLWREKRLVAEKPSGGAVFRFLTEECGLQTDVTIESYANKVRDWLRGNDYDVETYRTVKDRF